MDVKFYMFNSHIDRHIECCTRIFGKVNDHTLKELKALDAGSWFDHKYSGEKLCTLEEILVEYKSAAYLHVEIKGNTPNLAQKTCEMIRDFNAIEKTIIKK